MLVQGDTYFLAIVELFAGCFEKHMGSTMFDYMAGPSSAHIGRSYMLFTCSDPSRSQDAGTSLLPSIGYAFVEIKVASVL
jgi:hypothetical protein